MTMKMIKTVAKAIKVGMDFDTVVATVKNFTDDMDITNPTDANFGLIIVGDYYGDSVIIDFDVDDLVENVKINNYEDEMGDDL